MRPEPLDEYNLPLVIDRSNQPVVIALDVEDNSIRTYDACIGIALLYIRGIRPIRLISFVEPCVECGFHRALFSLSGHTLHEPRQRTAGDDAHSLSIACSQDGHKAQFDPSAGSKARHCTLKALSTMALGSRPAGSMVKRDCAIPDAAATRGVEVRTTATSPERRSATNSKCPAAENAIAVG